MAKTVRDLMTLLDCSEETVLAGLRAGRLPGVQPVPRGKWIIPDPAFERLAQTGRWSPGTATHDFIKHRTPQETEVNGE